MAAEVERLALTLLLGISLILIVVNIAVLLGVTDVSIQANHVPNLEYYFDDGNMCIVIDSVDHATGTSMRPRSFTGNAILWKNWDGNKGNLKEGQIVLVDDENNYYAHTIYALYPEYLITWGDNNPLPDEKIPYSSVKRIALGVVYT